MQTKRRGHAVVEVALLLPWLAFSFMAALDFGYTSYALISTQSAARVVAMYASVDSATALAPALACRYALEELRFAPNVGAGVSTCDGPVQVNTAYLPAGADGLPAVRVTVTYQTIRLLPLPGIMSGQFTMAQTVQMPLRTTT